VHGLWVEFEGRYELGPEGDYASFGPGQDGTPLQTRTGRMFYRISKDQGATWGPQKQLIQHCVWFICADLGERTDNRLCATNKMSVLSDYG
jgi:hypothetical protein